ncbi:MAG: metal-dependent hydrolase [Vicinamibacteria bacterium]|nr:metal-dependent hydrolase [Vicinamibacteria bacterium]
MDNLTHTLVGVTLVRAGLGARTAGATSAMILASNLPDVDIVAAFDGGLAYFAAHRGWTHGPLGAATFAVLAALLVVGWRAARAYSCPHAWKDFGALCGVAVTGTLLHSLMDLQTSYGTRLLSPFVDTWFALDWLPIIDVYLWALLVIGFTAARLRPGARTTIARVVVAAIVCFYGVRATAHQVALTIAASTRADGTSSPCASAPTMTRHPTVIEAAHAGPDACLQAAALPSFFSPFQWRLVRQQSDGYELRDVTLGRGTTAQIFVPSQSDVWVALARRAPTARVFYAFSRFPATRSAALPDGTRRVRAMDVRFLGPSPRGLEPDPQARAPFAMTIEIASDGTVRSERLGN